MSSNTRAITEGALMAGLTIVIALIVMYAPPIPLVVPVLLALTPVPVAVVTFYYGSRIGVGASVVAFLTLFLFVGVQSVALSLQILLVGVAMGIGYRRFPLKPGIVLLVSVLAYFLTYAIVFGAFAQLLGMQGMVNELRGLIDSVFDSVKQMTEGMYGSTDMPGGVQDISSMFDRMKAWLITIIPAILGTYFLAAAGVGIIGFRTVMSRRGAKVGTLPPFRRWHLTWVYGWGFVLGLLITTLSGPLPDPLPAIGQNIFFFFQMLFAVQGLSVAWFMIGRWQVPNELKALAVVVVVLTGAAAILLVLLPWIGVLDAWLDFRKVEVRPDESDPNSGR